MIEAGHTELSIQRQCDLLGLHRSGYYYKPRPESGMNLALMRLLDEQYTRTPYYGVRRLHQHLCSLGYDVNIKRIRRLTRLMGLEAIYPKLIYQTHEGHKIYPYLLKGLPIERVNQVWSTDITFIPMRQGFMYLTAIMDWFSRFVELDHLQQPGCLVLCRSTHRGLGMRCRDLHSIKAASSPVVIYHSARKSQSAISMDGRTRPWTTSLLNDFGDGQIEYVYLNALQQALSCSRT